MTAPTTTITLLPPLRTGKFGPAAVFAVDDVEGVTAKITAQELGAVYTPQMFGAKGDGITDDRPAIQAAIDRAILDGGGTIFFPTTVANTYLLGSIGGVVDLPIPVSDANYQPVLTPQQYHFYLKNVVGLRFVGNGVTLKSTVTNGGIMVIFDGARDLVWDGVFLKSMAAFNHATGAVITAGMNGLAFTATTQDSDRIRILNVVTEATYTSLYTFGDPNSGFRVRNLTMDNALFIGGNYGIANHDNGDLLNYRNVRIVDVNARAFFCFGCDSIDAEFLVQGSFNNLFGLFLVKAYDADTTNLRLKISNRQITNGGIYTLAVQSQHNPAFQPTPCRVRNLRVDVDDAGNTGSSVGFDYYRDNVLQGFVQDGSAVVANVVQANGVRGFLNIDDLVPITGAFSILLGRGFYRTRYQTYNPALSFGGSAAGITYGLQAGEYYIVGGLCFVNLRITLTSKGVQVGAAAITLPVPSAPYATLNAVVSGFGNANMSGLTSPLTGYIDSAGPALHLREQGAAAVAPIDNTNFTDTADLLLSFCYPV